VDFSLCSSDCYVLLNENMCPLFVKYFLTLCGFVEPSSSLSLASSVCFPLKLAPRFCLRTMILLCAGRRGGKRDHLVSGWTLRLNAAIASDRTNVSWLLLSPLPLPLPLPPLAAPARLRAQWQAGLRRNGKCALQIRARRARTQQQQQHNSRSKPTYLEHFCPRARCRPLQASIPSLDL